MIDPISSLLSQTPPGAPLSAANGGAAPDFALALTDIMAAAMPVDVPSGTVAVLAAERQPPAVPGTDLPLAGQVPVLVTDAVAPAEPRSPRAVPTAAPPTLPTVAVPVADDGVLLVPRAPADAKDAAVAKTADDPPPEPRLEPALAWLMPPLAPLPAQQQLVPRPVTAAPIALPAIASPTAEPAGIAMPPVAAVDDTGSTRPLSRANLLRLHPESLPAFALFAATAGTAEPALSGSSAVAPAVADRPRADATDVAAAQVSDAPSQLFLVPQTGASVGPIASGPPSAPMPVLPANRLPARLPAVALPTPPVFADRAARIDPIATTIPSSAGPPSIVGSVNDGRVASAPLAIDIPEQTASLPRPNRLATPVAQPVARIDPDRPTLAPPATIETTTPTAVTTGLPRIDIVAERPGQPVLVRIEPVIPAASPGRIALAPAVATAGPPVIVTAIPPIRPMTNPVTTLDMRAADRPGVASADPAPSRPAAFAVMPAVDPVVPLRSATPAAVATMLSAPATRRGEDRLTVDPAIVSTAAPAQPLAVAATGDAQSAGIDLTRDPGLHRMIDRIETLRDAADARDTRIRLFPDRLGPVEVAVRRDGDAVHVHFTASDAATRQLIADAQPRLADLAEARGVRIDRATVDAGPGPTFGQTAAGGDSHQPRPQPRNDAKPARFDRVAASVSEPIIDHRIA